jgi:hypothetical protein
MSISDLVPAADPAGALADALALVREAAETLWSARADDDLVGVVAQVHQLTAALAAVEAGAVAEADARDVPRQQLHYGSTADWLTHVGGLRRGEGRRRVVRAKALTGPLSRTLQALVAGRMSPGQVDVIVDALDTLPPGDLLRARGEKVLVRQARWLDATELARAGRHLVEVVDPTGSDRRLEAALDREERAAHLSRTLRIWQDRAGGVHLRGRGSVEDGALIKAALLPLTSPDPASDPPTEAERFPDPRDAGARLWDALVATARHALDTHLPPETHGTPARLLVTLDHASLKGDLEAAGVGTTADGVELPPTVLRRLACDAEIIPAVLGTHGEPLDLGRTHRLVSPALWAALVIRDRHCTFPTCTRPPLMTHAHHIRHWADGGETTLDNLALLCGQHHRVIHHTPWQIRVSPRDRRPEFRPPPTAGPPPGWIRHRPRLE